jgi:CRP-like cAMP-binding protein
MTMLAGLPTAERERLLGRMERVHVRPKQVLIWADEPIKHVYFPINSVASLLALTGDGAAVEAGLVGHEGVIGLPLVFGTTQLHMRVDCQVGDGAWRMPADVFRQEAAREGPLRARLLLYAQVLFQQVAQTSGCNRAHPVEERCARWLLMTHDRVKGDSFRLTQEYLSIMLGVRRPSVTVVMGILQRAGLIHYHRGVMTIADRAGLEAAACECYAVCVTEAARLMGPQLPKPTN